MNLLEFACLCVFPYKAKNIPYCRPLSPSVKQVEWKCGLSLFCLLLWPRQIWTKSCLWPQRLRTEHMNESLKVWKAPNSLLCLYHPTLLSHHGGGRSSCSSDPKNFFCFSNLKVGPDTILKLSLTYKLLSSQGGNALPQESSPLGDEKGFLKMGTDDHNMGSQRYSWDASMVYESQMPPQLKITGLFLWIDCV